MLRTPRANGPAIRVAAVLVLLVCAGAARVEAQSADLSVTKTDSPDPVIAGTNLTYTITVANAGPNAAASVAMTDALPAGTTFVSMQQNAGPAATLTTPPVGGTGTVTATFATFAGGATATFTVVVNVNASTANGATITNTATVTSATATRHSQQRRYGNDGRTEAGGSVRDEDRCAGSGRGRQQHHLHVDGHEYRTVRCRHAHAVGHRARQHAMFVSLQQTTGPAWGP